MFDDPKKELQKLEDQLLAAEIGQEPAQINDAEFEELYGKILEEFGPQESSGGAPVSDPPIRNFANGYGKTAPAQPAAVPVPPAPEEPAAPQKGVKGLVFLVTVEFLAIAALAAYWLMELMG